MRFHDPQLLLLLLLLPPWVWLIARRARRAAALHLPDGAQIEALPDTLRSRLARFLPVLRVLLVALAITALARPQVIERETKVRSEGVDLMVVLDISTSMLAEDLRARAPVKNVPRGDAPPRNRLAMAKSVLAGFIRGRPADRIGLVAFAARPYPAAPLTLDHDWLLGAVTRLQTGAIEDGSAIGDALLAALNRLRDRPAASRAVILVTDGRNNAGAATPDLAAAAARTLGIRVHAIGIGSRGPAVIPIEDPLGGLLYRRVDVDLDEANLRGIAATTGGSYFLAEDRGSLVEVFRAIDRLESRPIEEKALFAYRELYTGLLLGVLALLMGDLALRASWLRTLP